MKDTIMFQEIEAQPELIKSCMDQNREDLKTIAKAILDFQPTNVLIVARGTSMHSGIYAKYLFQLYAHLPVAIATPSVFTIYDGTVNLQKTLVLAISQSGKGKDIHAVVKKAKEAGALTVGITNTPDSLVATSCQYHLWNHVETAESYAATKTFTSTMYLVSELVYHITKAEDLKIDENRVLEAIEKGLTYRDQIDELIQHYKNVQTLFTMARGKDLALAMEMALKLKETSHFPVNAYPCSEFYHGPIVMVNEHTPVILFGIDHVTNENVLKMVNDLKTLKASSLVISNDPKICKSADFSIYIDEEDRYALYTAIVVLQLFANDLSVLRGNNPDFHKILEHIETI